MCPATASETLFRLYHHMYTTAKTRRTPRNPNPSNTVLRTLYATRNLLRRVDDDLDNGLAVLVLAGLGQLEGLERVGKLVAVGDEGLEVDEAALNKANGEGVVTLSVAE